MDDSIKLITTRSASGSPKFNLVKNLLNRNYHDNICENDTLESSGGQSYHTRILKKMPANFQNINATGVTQSERIDGDDINSDHSYDLDYDKVIKNDTFDTRITTCDELCSNLDGYKLKHDVGANESCNNCSRTKCCELNTCHNAHEHPPQNLDPPVTGIDGICSVGFQRKNQYNNYLCSDPGCIADRAKCCEGKPLPPINNIKTIIGSDPANTNEIIYSPSGTSAHAPERSFVITPNQFNSDGDFGNLIFPSSGTRDGSEVGGISCNTGCGYANSPPMINANYTTIPPSWYLSGCAYNGGVPLCTADGRTNIRDTENCIDITGGLDGVDEGECTGRYNQHSARICGFIYKRATTNHCTDSAGAADSHELGFNPDSDTWAHPCRLPDGRWGNTSDQEMTTLPFNTQCIP